MTATPRGPGPSGRATPAAALVTAGALLAAGSLLAGDLSAQMPENPRAGDPWAENRNQSAPAAERDFFGYDRNADGTIERREWDDAYSTTEVFDLADGDADGAVTEAEFETAFEDEPWAFADWDADGDGRLRNAEFGRGLYIAYDDEGDGLDAYDYRKMTASMNEWANDLTDSEIEIDWDRP